MTDQVQVRKEFEDWASSHPYLSKCRKSRNRFVEDDYFDPVMSVAWMVWQSLVNREYPIKTIHEDFWGIVFSQHVDIKEMEDCIKELSKDD